MIQKSQGNDMKERLDKLIASQTALSRREVQKAVRDKRVAVNGEVIRSAELKVDIGKDTVTLDGTPVTYQEHVYYMMYKPPGVVSATEDRTERTVLDLLPPELKRSGLFPAGRLDKDTTGLLILTDDGDYAHRMLSPKKHVMKRYLAVLDREPDAGVIRTFAEGIVLADGTVCKSAKAELTGGREAAVEISEGKYHQVKRMFASQGYRVTALKRVRIGALTLDEALGEGGVRAMSRDEAEKVFQS